MAQLCCGLCAGMEGAIHAMRELFDLHTGDDWGVLLVMLVTRLILSIVWLLYGMPECFGLGVPAFCLILTWIC